MFLFLFLFVSFADVHGGFGFDTTSPLLTIVGDDVTLTCHAHQYTYEDYPQIAFVKQNVDQTLINTTDTTVVNARFVPDC